MFTLQKIRELKQTIKENKWRWIDLENRKTLYGETADYFHRKEELKTFENNIESEIRFIEKLLAYKVKISKENDFSFDEWRDTLQNWSELSREIRG